MKLTFTAELKKNDNGFCGIVIYRNDGCVRRYEEITRDQGALETLVHYINEGDVSDVHIYDILEDIIG